METDERRPLLADYKNHSPRSSPRKPKSFEQQNKVKNKFLTVVFVVSFDTKKGNVVEWCFPSGVNLEGLEFKSLASGLHTVDEDFIYFKFYEWYGLSCFGKIAVASEAERGVRMKCVGILADNYEMLHVHKDFLQRQVNHQLLHPRDYGSLEEYFRHFTLPETFTINPNSHSTDSTSVDVPRPVSPEGAFPMQCIDDYLEYFDASIFVLWKLALLQKRIIFCSPPPVGPSCFKVFCTCLMTSHKLAIDIDTDNHPQFYISVSDMDLLKSKRTFIACTTEVVMRDKKELYDIFVSSNNITCHSQYCEPLLVVSRQDHARYSHLEQIRRNMQVQRGHGSGTEEHWFASFFEDLNHKLFEMLTSVSESADHVVTLEHISQIGLDPTVDRLFVANVALLHGFDVNVQRTSDMCCLFNCM